MQIYIDNKLVNINVQQLDPKYLNVVAFDVNPQWLIYRIKEFLEETPAFVEGVVVLDGPTNVYICDKQRQKITIELIPEVFKEIGIQYIWFNDCLYTYDDLQEYKSFTR